MNNLNSMSYKFENHPYHYLVCVNSNRDVMHVLEITSQDLSKISLESMIDTFKNNNTSEEEGGENMLLDERYKLKTNESLFFSFHSFKDAAMEDKCLDIGLCHSMESKTKAEIEQKIKALDDGQFRKFLEIKKEIF